jgi:hypothetical protein
MALPSYYDMHVSDEICEASGVHPAPCLASQFHGTVSLTLELHIATSISHCSLTSKQGTSTESYLNSLFGSAQKKSAQILKHTVEEGAVAGEEMAALFMACVCMSCTDGVVTQKSAPERPQQKRPHCEGHL